MTKIAQARAFAENAHAGQTRKGPAAEPYITHLAEVAALTEAHGGDEAAICAAWLHDTVEDCPVSSAEIVALFGAEIAGYVAELTDDKHLDKAGRKRMQLVNAPGKSDAAALVKLCDKMSNVRAVGDTPPVHWPLSRQSAYLDFAEAVVAALPRSVDAARPAFAACLARSRAQLGQRGAPAR